MADVDHFKKINDTYGHNFGDQILKMISVKLSSNLREKDKVARWGGEEFVLVLPETSIKQATDIANRIRVSIEQTQIDTPDGNEKISVTISFGIAISALNDQKIDLIIDQADMALYQAKSNGRNCVRAYKKAS
jgi:diguanylate cyclase (GGDEF)-like protein